jgi:hypothetical protein
MPACANPINGSPPFPMARCYRKCRGDTAVHGDGDCGDEVTQADTYGETNKAHFYYKLKFRVTMLRVEST